MKRLIILVTTIFFFFGQNKAQTPGSEIKVNYAKCDSIIKSVWEKGDFISAIYYINYFLSLDTTQAYLYYNRAQAKKLLMDINGACKDWSIAKELHYPGITHSDKKFIDFYCDKSYLAKQLQKYYDFEEKLSESNNYRPEYTKKDTLRGMLSPERTCFDVTYYNLNVKVMPKKKYIYGRTDIHFNLKNNTNTIQIDLFERFKIDSIIWDNKKLQYSRSYDAVFIKFDEELINSNNEYISIYYQGEPIVAKDPPWFGGFVWKKDRMKHLIGVCCEHLGASSWWPNKDHLSDKPDSMTISIEVPEDYKAIANGNLINETKTDNGFLRYTWHVSYPITNYNATFYCGNYINVRDSLVYGDKTISLDYYVLPHHKSKALPFFEQSKEVIEVYSKLFGPYPYPNDGFGLVESSYAAMEHQGAIAFGNKFRNRYKPYDNNEFDYIILHEIAHEWWGNAISFSDMADSWISEGFATYSEMLFMEHKYGYQQYMKEISRTTMYITDFWPIIGNFNVNENTFAGGDIYNKGAIILHHLRCIINNDDIFMKLLQDYYQKYKYQSIKTDRFVEMAEEYSNMNLAPFFNKFLHDTKPPTLSYNILMDGDDIIFIYKWTGVETDFSMPFSLIDENNKQLTITGSTIKCFTRLDNTQSIKFVLFYMDDVEFNKNTSTYFTTKLDPGL